MFFTEFSDKKIVYSKRTRTCHLLCNRPECYHSASKTHMRDRIFKSSPNHASMIIRFPEFSESSTPFRKNSNKLLKRGKVHLSKVVNHTIVAKLSIDAVITGREWLIRSYSSARFCFELSGIRIKLRPVVQISPKTSN